MKRSQSAMYGGIRPLRALFEERCEETRTTWQCRLCDYFYAEFPPVSGWPLSIDGLFVLTKHLRGHTHS